MSAKPKVVLECELAPHADEGVYLLRRGAYGNPQVYSTCKNYCTYGTIAVRY